MKLYNTLTRKKEEFIPIEEGKVKMYVCGPTVYDLIHVGNARPLVTFDTLRRYFAYKGYDVKYVVNFTDIDDKIIKRANEEGLGYKDISEKYIGEFKKDGEGLSLYEEKTWHPKATEYIQEIVDFTQGLIDKEAAYEVAGNVYFDISKTKDYGKLSKKNIDELISGARIEVNDEKRSPMDFVLWKKAKENEPSWDSPWGAGRPGWHIECSVMAKELLGDTIDIHAGGEDLQFPHHENEIAQSETLTGKSFANYWMHNSMIYIDNKKMSKSESNFFTIREIGEKFDLEILRFFILSSHYRSPLNFSEESVLQAEKGLERLYNGKKNLEYLIDGAADRELDNKDEKGLEILDKYKESFMISMDDDLNTADGIASLFDLVRYSNTNFDEKTPKRVLDHAYYILLELAKVLGILAREDEILEDEILDLIEKRGEARKNKNYELADEIRDELEDKGIVLEDTKEGVKWKRI